ncbi:hypothetical protein F2Q68_00016163 [Brassica cretica]|uniref:Uncharacterized protein n=1 Tax=Brassica cretica TaxID=69181 RepID=A0A8S9HC66_BRACR|nr:hypothetical protein F2Q68_00016163 [Brassica cretica]
MPIEASMTFNKTRTSLQTCLYALRSNAPASSSEIIGVPCSIISKALLKSPSIATRVNGSKRRRQTPVYYKRTGPPPGSECGSGLRGTRDSRITGAMSCLRKAY